jgi:anti-anti-sigma regulatory factor
MNLHTDETGCVHLAGQVTVEDAEALMHALRASDAPSVDLSACEHLHAAAIQVLLALRPRLISAPADAWLRAALCTLKEPSR